MKVRLLKDGSDGGRQVIIAAPCPRPLPLEHSLETTDPDDPKGLSALGSGPRTLLTCSC